MIRCYTRIHVQLNCYACSMTAAQQPAWMSPYNTPTSQPAEFPAALQAAPAAPPQQPLPACLPGLPACEQCMAKESEVINQSN